MTDSMSPIHIDSPDPNNIEPFPWFLDLSSSLRSRILEKISFIQGLPDLEETFMSDPVLPETSNLATYLSYINAKIIDFRGKNPTQAYYFLSILYSKLKEIPSIQSQPEYLRTLSEWIAAMSNTADYLSGIKKIEEIDTLIKSYLSTILQVPSIDNLDDFFVIQAIEDVELSDDTIFLYRDTLLHTVVNVAYFYARIGDYTNSSKYVFLGKILSTKFCSAQVKFELFLLQISTFIDQWIYNSSELDIALKSAHQWLDILSKIYASPEYIHIKQILEVKLRTLELFIKIKNLEERDITIIAQIMRERDELIELSINEDKQRLFQIEVLLYMMIQELQDDDEYMGLAMEQNSKDFQFVINGQKKINKNGFYLDFYLNGSNARFFLSSFIELFDYLVRRFVTNPRPLPQAKLQVFDMMIDIYDIATSTGNRLLNRKLFQLLPGYKQYIRSANLLIEDLLIGESYDEDDLLDVMNVISIERSNKEALDISHAISFLETKWWPESIRRLRIGNVIVPIDYYKNNVNTTDAHLNQAFSSIYAPFLIPEDVKFQESNLVTSIQQSMNLTEDIRELEPFFQKQITIIKLERVFETLFHSRSSSKNTSSLENTKIFDLKQAIGDIILPAEFASQEESFLRIKNRNFLRKNRSSIDVRRHISIDIIDANYVSNSVDSPILISYPWQGYVSVVFASTLSNGTMRYIVRYWIERNDQDMPAFIGLSVLYIEQNGYVYAEDPKTADIELLPVFKKQLQQLINKIGPISTENIEDRIPKELIHSDSIGTFVYKWKDDKWARIIEVNAKYNWNSIQCDFTLSAEWDGTYTIYVWSMIRTWVENQVNTNAMLKWMVVSIQWYLKESNWKLIHEDKFFVKLIRDSEHQTEWELPKYKRELFVRWAKFVMRWPEKIDFSPSVRTATFRSYFFPSNRVRV